MTVQTSRYAGRQKNPQHSKKMQAFVQNTLNILSLPSYTSVDTAGKCCSAASDPPGLPSPCLGSLQGAHLPRDPAEAASDPWDPQPHPTGTSRFCQQQNSICRPLLHTQTPTQSCSPQAGCRQVKQTLAEFSEQLQRFQSPGISLAPKFGVAAPTTARKGLLHAGSTRMAANTGFTFPCAVSNDNKSPGT